MTFLKEQQPLVEDSLLTKYFGVRDTTLKDLYTETSSDASFYKLAEKIERKSRQSSKAVKHRIECWLRKLCQQTKNHDWKRNRNNYAVLLLEMLEKNDLDFPFNKRPDDGPLKTLPSYLRPYSTRYRPAATFNKQEGRQGATNDKGEDIVSIASAAVDVLHEHNRSRSVLSAINSSNGFRYDAEIQLGACRERVLELEMQLNTKNDHLVRVEKKMLSMKRAHQKEIDKYRHEIKSLKGFYTKSLDKIIMRYTRHLQNSRTAEIHVDNQDNGEDRSKQLDDDTSNQEYLEFLEKFRDKMQILKQHLHEGAQG